MLVTYEDRCNDLGVSSIQAFELRDMVTSVLRTKSEHDFSSASLPDLEQSFDTFALLH